MSKFKFPDGWEHFKRGHTGIFLPGETDHSLQPRIVIEPSDYATEDMYTALRRYLAAGPMVVQLVKWGCEPVFAGGLRHGLARAILTILEPPDPPSELEQVKAQRDELLKECAELLDGVCEVSGARAVLPLISFDGLRGVVDAIKGDKGE